MSYDRFTLPTITMVKGSEEIIVNASERELYVKAGYENKPEEVQAKETAKPAADAEAKGAAEKPATGTAATKAAQ